MQYLNNISKINRINDFKKGITTYNSKNNLLLQTGYHNFIDTYNFFNNSPSNTIGAIKPIDYKFNPILFTPDKNFYSISTLSEDSSNYVFNPFSNPNEYFDNPYLSPVLSYDYTETINITDTCYFGPVYNNKVPVKIEILDNKRPDLIYYIRFGYNTTYSNQKAYANWSCVLSGTTTTYITYDCNFIQLGFIPNPTLTIDYAYWQPCCAIYLSPYSTRTVQLEYASEKDIKCNGGRLQITTFRKGIISSCTGYGSACSGVFEYPDYIGFQECVVGKPAEEWSSYRVFGFSFYNCISVSPYYLKLKIYWKNITLSYSCS